MTLKFEAVSQDSFFAIATAGKSLITPGKKPFAVPSKALAEAIAGEWQAHQKFKPAAMLLTALAYTAIDRIDTNQPAIVEALLVYIDTDTLSYRTLSSEKLSKQQDEQWNPILVWAKKTFGATWETTTGVMPIDQPKELHSALAKYLNELNAMQLAAACQLASLYSSLALAVSVLKKHINASEAFHLSRLEEEHQAEQWGRDEEAEGRTARLQAEIVAAGRFLDLLGKA